MESTRKMSKALLGGVVFFLLIFILVVSQAAAGTCVIPPSGLVSWWDGDAVSGTTASDIQDGNDGTLLNGATTAPGFVGNAFSFDGATVLMMLFSFLIILI